MILHNCHYDYTIRLKKFYEVITLAHDQASGLTSGLFKWSIIFKLRRKCLLQIKYMKKFMPLFNINVFADTYPNISIIIYFGKNN